MPGGGGACFCCRLTAARRRELLQTWSSSAHPCHVPAEAGGWASTPGVAAMTAGLQVEMGLRWLARGRGEAGSIEFSLEGSRRMEEVSLSPNAACPFHGAGASGWRRCPGRFEEALQGDEEICWEWPVCVRARCQECRQEWRPRLRVARLRKEGRCPRCGSRRILEIENLASVWRGSEWAQSAPAEVGLPPEHLYSIRKRSEYQGTS